MAYPTYNVSSSIENFQDDIEIKSESFDSEEIYLINLSKMTCTCKDFEKSDRASFPKNDFRRMCKHIRKTYNDKIGVHGFTPLEKSIFRVGLNFKRDFYLLNLVELKSPIIILYNEDNDWWDLFLLGKTLDFEEYSYSVSDERFSYDRKPYGLVGILRPKLKEIRRELLAEKTETENKFSRLILELDIDFHNTFEEVSKNCNFKSNEELFAKVSESIDIKAAEFLTKHSTSENEKRLNEQIQALKNLTFKGHLSKGNRNSNRMSGNYGCSLFILIFILICFLISMVS